jgi:DNA-directed RNA polymerase specialized sigma24 family protein
MDVDSIREPVPPLLALVPRLRRLARALACDAGAADALVLKTLERALADEEKSWARLVRQLCDCWSAQPDRRRTPRTAVDAAMDALPAGQRGAVALVLVGGLRYAEAAERLGIDIAVLADRLARGRRALAERLAA